MTPAQHQTALANEVSVATSLAGQGESLIWRDRLSARRLLANAAGTGDAYDEADATLAELAAIQPTPFGGEAVAKSLLAYRAHIYALAAELA